MKFILIAILAVLPSAFSYADESDEAVFEQQSYDFGDYKEVSSAPKADTFGFENSAPTSLSQTETPAVVANAIPMVGPAPASEYEHVDELSNKEVNARTQEGFATANGALPSDDGSMSVNLRSTK